MDIALKYKNDFGFDLSLSGNDFESDSTLKTAIIISLFTDKRVTPDELPEGQRDARGFWGDSFEDASMGSKLWLLEREKHTDEVRELARAYAEEALQWLIDDRIAAAVEVTVEKISLEQSLINVNVVRPFGNIVDYSFDYVWKGLNATE